jgi:hypothetical protein
MLQVSSWLRQSFAVENDVALMASYLAFLVEHTPSDSLAELTEATQDMAQLVVERSSICAALLPSPGKRVRTSDSLAEASLWLESCRRLFKTQEHLHFFFSICFLSIKIENNNNIPLGEYLS